MATTGWGDESSSGSEDEGPVLLPEVTEAPPKAVSSLQQQASGRGSRQQSHVRGGGGRHAAGGRVERGGGGRHQARGAGRQQHDDWKTAAKQASILHRTQEQPVDGSNWMAQRQKKLQEQKLKDEQLRREQKQLQELESKERRANQLQALNAAVKTMQQDQTTPSSSLQQAVSGEAPARRPSQPKETSWRERATHETGPVSPRQHPAKAKGENVSPPTGRGGRGNAAAEPNTWRERAAIEEKGSDSSKGGRGGRGRGRGRGHVSPNATKPVAVLQKPVDANPSVDSKKQKMKVKNMPDGSVVVTKAESKVDASHQDDVKGKSSSLQKALHPHDTGTGREGRSHGGRGRDDAGRGRDHSGRGRGAKGGGRNDSGRGRGEKGGGNSGRGRGARGRGRDDSGRGRSERGGGRDS